MSVCGVLTWLGHKETFVENGRRSDGWDLEHHGFCLLEDMPMPLDEQKLKAPCGGFRCSRPVLFGFKDNQAVLLTTEAREESFGLGTWLGYYQHMAQAAKKAFPEAEYVALPGHSIFSAELSPLRQVACALRRCFLGASKLLGGEAMPAMGAVPDFIHADHSVEEGTQLVSAALSELSRIKTSKKRRVVAMNMWRNARSSPIKNHHLAVVNAQTVSDEELRAAKFKNYAMGGLQQYHMTHLEPQHRLVYFPHMQDKEILAFKQGSYEVSPALDHTQVPCTECMVTPQAEVHASHVLHTSFLDPTAPSDAVPRKAIACEGILVFMHEA
ncbi:unnamed protein product [Effrenium voratum]|nr:unnamed protein product [Effrenium voratum]